MEKGMERGRRMNKGKRMEKGRGNGEREGGWRKGEREEGRRMKKGKKRGERERKAKEIRDALVRNWVGETLP